MIKLPVFVGRRKGIRKDRLFVEVSFLRSGFAPFFEQLAQIMVVE